MKKLPMHYKTKCLIDLVFQSKFLLTKFQKLCEKALIDHQTILQKHPKANELVKRMV
jgi:hypothetical protein